MILKKICPTVMTQNKLLFHLSWGLGKIEKCFTNSQFKQKPNLRFQSGRANINVSIMSKPIKCTCPKQIKEIIYHVSR